MPSIGVARKQRQRYVKRARASCAIATIVAFCLAFPSATRVRAAAPAGGGRWVLTDAPQRWSGEGTRDVRVWLPPSYDRPESATRRYPVVVFLHGWPGSEGNWPGQGRAGETLGSLIAEHKIPEVVGLFPDGGGIGLAGRSLWLDAWNGKQKLETFVTRDLFAWADTAFRLREDAADRAVIGLSDGATGAMNFLIRDPGVFGAAGGHSGDYIIRRDFSNRGIFGPEPEAAKRREEASPLLTILGAADHLRGKTIYLDCGQDDSSIDDNRAMHARLDSLHIAHTYAEYPNGHDWGYWRTHLVQSLEAVTKGMK